ncbi:PREDICTED: MICOS complex subunit MIC60 [Nelumbo nucifera]|uniref:MICOS complex subunit MIC60 n=2 Tax=Nelumbo nucifera TaxID=4432 RepID=A0A1U8A2E1_NELNU|nr:PREDICTED: MICOS complex subunit MIC60 [Nelumbo nucifera]XP_010261198.1 PREDICTED: MICOS complex subunit MIC60 [Nelumbo nucifera]DAD40251.1 TPA_asm: hypothetical protein HUJ06_014574 [Nelumbo nucifera]
MMRRCIWEISSGRSVRRIPRQIMTQIPSFLSSRKEYSVASQPGSTGKPSESGSGITKFVIGGVAVGAAVMGAYQMGYLDKLYVQEYNSTPDSAKPDSSKTLRDTGHLGEQLVLPSKQETNGLSSDMIHTEKTNQGQSDAPIFQDLGKSEGESQVKDRSHVMLSEDTIPIQEQDSPSFHQDSVISDGQGSHFDMSTENDLISKGMDSSSTSPEDSREQDKGAESTPVLPDGKTISEEVEMEAVAAHHHTSDGISAEALGNDAKPTSSLPDTYFLQENDERSPGISLMRETTDSYGYSNKEKEASLGTSEDLKTAYISKDGQLVLDFLQAIHAAEKRQAELDAQVFAEEKRILKEKYEKELKDARARELMYAEEAAILDKELNKDRAKAATTIKSLQEKAEENLKRELERKENEAELHLKKVQELSKAELAAAIASEKASQIEKMAEANLHINALCMAFYARSEEARQTHSVHKLALGAIALEDALAKGLPIQTDIDALQNYLEGIDKDSFLGLVLSSLPEETLNHGTDTLLQLNQKFDALKGTVRHYSFIPPGGGGIMAHSLAHIASLLKVREDDQSGDGIESVINRVESFLAEGKLAEAADALEGGVRGSQAEEVIGDWVKQARNRAITEQALSLLQSYATSISIS